MAVPLLDLSSQHAELLPELRGAFEAIVRSGVFVLRPRTEALERRLEQLCAARHSVALSSGTDALLVAMMALGIGAGDEVITSPFTFFATAGSIARVGARPVFVDIEPTTFNLDPARLEGAISPRTRAIMPVHLYGQTADMKPIMALARQRHLAVIEDACQSIGARYGDQVSGAIGDVGCLSFYPTKNLAALGDAGACVTNNADLHQKIVALRRHGEVSRYHHSLIGGNFRIDEIQAAMLTLKLPRLEAWTQRRRALARRYYEALGGLPLQLPIQAPGRYHVYNQFTVRVAGERRDALRQHLASRGVAHGVYYPVPLHLQKCFEYLGYSTGAFPEAERAAAEVLSLPIYPELPDSKQDEVVQGVREFFR